MAKIKLSEGGFSLIPEGVTVFKVMEVDDSKYEDFGKLSVKQIGRASCRERVCVIV